MGKPIPQQGILSGSKFNLSHQELDRVLEQLDTLWSSLTMVTGDEAPVVEWLPVEGSAYAICHELGYEDMDEFEDALSGTFADLLAALPHIEMTTWPDGRRFFKIKPEPPKEAWRPLKLTFKVQSTADLWRVCFKSPYARIEIPELEFEISADGKRHVDSLYNHIGAAIFNLGNYVKGARTTLSEDHQNKIIDTLVALNVFLDVEKPWTWIVHDPSGLSEFKPLEDVVVEWEDEVPGETEQVAAAAST